MRIFKYFLELKFGTQDLFMPPGAIFLDVQLQGGRLVFWAHVNERLQDMPKRFYVYATGDDVPTTRTYLKTIQQGSLVYHIFV